MPMHIGQAEPSSLETVREAFAGHPNRKCIRMMIGAPLFGVGNLSLEERSAAKFSAPDQQCFTFLGIEAQFGLAFVGIRTVTMETIFGKDGTYFPGEVNPGRGKAAQLKAGE